jgi:hypothetical protein
MDVSIQRCYFQRAKATFHVFLEKMQLNGVSSHQVRNPAPVPPDDEANLVVVDEHYFRVRFDLKQLLIFSIKFYDFHYICNGNEMRFHYRFQMTYPGKKFPRLRRLVPAPPGPRAREIVKTVFGVPFIGSLTLLEPHCGAGAGAGAGAGTRTAPGSHVLLKVLSSLFM